LKFKRAHKHLIGLFAFAAVLLVILNIAVILTPEHQAIATTSENVMGWAWSDTGGWLSLNNTNAGSGGGSYGVNVNLSTKEVTGFAWSDSQGWVCFGSSCTVAGCANGVNAPSIVNGNAQPYAYMQGGGSSYVMRGWGMVCALGTSNGWVGFNSQDDTGGAAYGVTLNAGNFGGYGWHAALSSPSVGWGWMSFSGAYMAPEDTTGFPACHDLVDNNLSGSIDCADSSCNHKNDSAHRCPVDEASCAPWGSNCCSNGLDDDGNGITDCADPACAADPVCMPEICDNGIDDNANGLIDCADVASCGSDPRCIPAWLKTEYGNVYASSGIAGNAPPVNQYNATYCLTTAGSITGFESTAGCKEAGSTQALSLPTGAGTGGYVSKLGRIDVSGVLSGRYGTVVSINTDADIPAVLDGKVYLYDRDAHGGACPSGEFFSLGVGHSPANPMLFNNAANSPTARGNGLLVIKGCKLKIVGNLAYQATGVQQYLKNLASFGVLVLSKYSGGTYQSGGEMYIDPSVNQVVGMYFVEKAIYTGSVGTIADLPLYVYGALISRDIKLERRVGSSTEGSENVIFDGRGVANPPPGTQDITKSLPSVKDTY
jgi:hypothetical protein